MPLPTLTRDLARAAAADAANRQARAAGRAAWSEEDYNLACAEFERLCPTCPACTESRLHLAEEWERFHPSMWAELADRQRAGLLKLGAAE